LVTAESGHEIGDRFLCAVDHNQIGQLIYQFAKILDGNQSIGDGERVAPERSDMRLTVALLHCSHATPRTARKSSDVPRRAGFAIRERRVKDMEDMTIISRP